MSSSYAFLAVTRALIVKGWTQHAFARDKDGNSVHFDHQLADCWSLTGALNLAYQRNSLYKPACALSVLKKLEENAGSESLRAFNDSPDRTKADVLALIGETMEAFPGEESATSFWPTRRQEP